MVSFMILPSASQKEENMERKETQGSILQMARYTRKKDEKKRNTKNRRAGAEI